MKVAYFSPLNPQKSGISDFSEELLPYLKKKFDVDIFVDGIKPTNNLLKQEFVIREMKEYNKESIRSQYDIAVFHIGNNYELHNHMVELFLKFGGILELHDISLHHYLAEKTVVRNNKQKYIDIMTYCHGQKGRKVAEQFWNGEIPAPWENLSMTFTVCKYLVDKATAVIVHSDFAKQTVKGMKKDAMVINIPLHTPDIEENYLENKVKCREMLGIDQNTVVMGAFGYVTSEKRILQIIEALKHCNQNNKKNFKFYIVGKVVGVDLDKKIKESKLDKKVIITGFTTLDEFKRYMGACDFCFNLRYPTQGESSASIHRMFGLGKPVIVTDIGTFEEYPEDVVIKVSYGKNEVRDIVNGLKKLISNSDLRDKMSKNSLEYAKKECSIEQNAQLYYDFFVNISNNTFENQYEDILVDKICELELWNNNYLKHISTVIDCV